MPDAFDPYYLWLGIPPEEQPPNYYRLLTVKLYEKNPDVIAGAADRQMAHVRSFQSGKHAAESQKLLNDLSAARLCLLSADKKAQYDQTLKAKLARVQAAAAPPPAPAAAAAKPLRVAQARPVPAQATPENALGFDPLAQTASPRHRSRRSTAQQPTLLIGAGAALLAVTGVVWLLAGGSDQPDKPPAKPIAAVDRATQGSNRDTFDSKASEREAGSEGAKPRRENGPKRKPAKLDKSSDNSSDDAADNAASTMSDDEASGNTADEMPVDDSADDDPELSASADDALEDAPAREAVPDAAAVKTAVTDIQKLFKDDFTSAKKPDQKAALAKKLLALAGDNSMPLERFALLNEAKRLAIGAADVALAMQAIDALAAQFELERLAQAADMAESLGNKELPAPARQALVETVAPLVDEAIAAGQLAAARRLAAVGLAAARKGNQVDIAKVLVRQLHDLAGQEKLAEAAEAAREQLKSKPDDADAHLALGKYLCFAVGNWAEGLPHLQQGSDARLRSIAERELVGAESTTDRIKVGDLWWDLSDDQKGADKDRYRSRAGYWYEQAVGELTGLSKTKVEKRLADLPASATIAAAKPGTSKQSNRIAVGKWVDLLPLVDPQKQTLRGKWTITPDGLLSETRAAPIQIPVTIAGSYELEVGFTRLAGADAIAFMIPTGDTQTMLAISGGGGKLSGIFDIDGRPAEDNESALRPGSIENGKRHLLKVRVQPRGDEVAIDSTLDGHPYVHWQGSARRLTTNPGWAPPQIHQPALGVWDSAVFHSVKFKLLTGTATIDADAGPASAPANGSSAKTALAKPDKPIARAGKSAPKRSTSKTHFLTELRPEEVRTYSGLLGYDVFVGGVASPHGIGMHPTSNGSAHVAYDLAEGYQKFSGSVGISDSAMGTTATALTFRIVGDGKERWKSRPLQKTGDSQEFDVSVAKVGRLELFVDCPGYDGAAHAVWIEPQLTGGGTGGGGSSSSESKLAAIGKWVDLLALADPVKEDLAAVWQHTPEGLRVERRETPLPIPMVVEGDYSLHVEFTRQSGRDTVVVILPIKSKQCMLALSGHDGDESGFEIINGQDIRQNAASLRPGTLENGHRYSLDVEVRQARGQHTIETKLDGKPYVRWNGEITSLGLTRNWTISRPNVIAIAGNEPTVFHVAKFKLLAGKATMDRGVGPKIDSTPGSSDTARPGKGTNELLQGAVLIATFDEPTIVRKGSEVRVRDLSGKQKPGLVEGAEFAPGKSGRALEFQKVGDRVDFGDDPSLNPPALTACVWIKPSAHDNQWADILCKYHGDNGHSGFVLRLDRNTPDLTIGIGDGVWRESPAKTAVPTGEWTHLAATYDDKTQDFYINGHPAVSRPASGAALTSPSRCYIGMSDQYPGRQFFGLIDEVALFDRALSPEEIQQIYQLGAEGKSLVAARPALKPSAKADDSRPTSPATAETKPAKSPSSLSAALPAGAKLYLSFANDTTSTTGDSIRVNDLSGRSNGATSTGAAALVKGKIGQALALNGGELRITPLLNGLSNFTVSAWVCLTGDEEFIVLEEGNPGGPGARILISPSREIGLELWHFHGPPDNWLRSHTKADVVPTGKWFHIVVRLVDGTAKTGKAIVTINGKSLELPAQAMSGHPSTFARIGGAGSAMVDEIAVFDRALTDVETSAIYQTGLKQKMLVPAK